MTASMSYFRLGLLLPSLLLAVSAFAANGPVVVVSIKPLHALVAGVMQDVAEPRLLIKGAASPHDYNLRPSDVLNVNKAHAVFWIGEDLESALARLLASAEGGRSVKMLKILEPRLLPIRRGGTWAPDEAEREAHPHQDYDVHVWLDPHNAIAMTRHISAVLTAIDPTHKTDYEKNAVDLIQRLEQLDHELEAALAPIRGVPYLVFHDAYQYFEHRYRLNSVGALAVSPERQPGARRVQAIRNRIRSSGIRCVFSEPQFPPALVDTLIEDTDARRGVLDPLGAELPAGSEAYFQLLRNLAASLRACLAADP